MISLKVKEKNTLDGITISNLNKKLNGRIIVCAIERDNQIIVPRGTTKIQKNDIIHLTGIPKNIMEFLKLVDLDDKTRKVIISGGSSTSVYLAKYLTEMGMAVKLIEIDEERCNVLSEKLPEVLVIHGDSSDQELLYEEGIEECDAFVALTSIDEENIVYSMFAAMQEVPKIITKVNHINLDGIIEKASIDTVVTPHKIATNVIVKYVRAMQYGENSSCESIYKFDDDKFEMVEFKVAKDFEKINSKIKELELKDGVLIVAILRGKNIIFPSGNDKIFENDTIVIIDSESKIQELNDILV
jgi:trk system potassium uptake protein TrkA